MPLKPVHNILWNGLPTWLRWWRIHLQCRRPGFSPWVKKVPWRRKWLPTSTFLPREFDGQRNLVGYHPWSHKDSDTTEQLILISSFQPLSRVRLYVTPWTAAHQTSLSITNSETRSDSCPSSWWCHPTISSSSVPFSSCLQSFSASGSFPMSQLFPSGGQTIGISASAAVLPINTQDWFPLLAGSLYYPRDSQESSPTPQIKSINSSVLSFLYGPTLTSIHDYWKNHSFE